MPLKKADFLNCIIHGNKSHEVRFDLFGAKDDIPSTAKYLFDHCLMKVDTSKVEIEDVTHYRNIIFKEAPSFIDSKAFNFQLDTLSDCKDTGSVSIAQKVPLNILEVSRLDDKGPDLGAYERVE